MRAVLLAFLLALVGLLLDGVAHGQDVICPPNWLCLQQQIDALPVSGGTIEIPAGTFDAAPVVVNKPVIISGAGPAFGTASTTVLRFGANVVGFDFVPGSAASVLRQVRISNQPNANTNGRALHGIRIQSHRITIERAHVSTMGSHGIVVRGMYPDNANNWRIDSVRIDGCGGDGVYIDGGDANSGIGIGVDSTANGGWGIHDSSFLGNTWVGCHTSSNLGGSYRTGSQSVANYSTFLACYAEGNQPSPDFGASTNVLVIGGNIAGNAQVTQRIGFQHSRVVQGDGDITFAGPTSVPVAIGAARFKSTGRHAYLLRRFTSPNDPWYRRNAWAPVWINSGGIGTAPAVVTDELDPAGPGLWRWTHATQDSPWLLHLSAGFQVAQQGAWQAVTITDARLGQGSHTLSCAVGVLASGPVELGGHSISGTTITAHVRSDQVQAATLTARCERYTP